MNKKGFTLVELLAVIAILALIMGIAITSVVSTQKKALENVKEEKISELIKSAILYGQENPEALNNDCPLEYAEYKNCLIVNAKLLIDNSYYDSGLILEEGKKELINDVTKKSMLEDQILIYRRNNRVMATSWNIISDN